MCGICGAVWTPTGPGLEPDTLERMCYVLRHRGPDDQGTWLTPGVALGHRRLSIIDLAGGHQPLSNEDATVSIVFNGEIYNFPELRRDLAARGHRFQTRSDTECIVHLYEERGIDCLASLRGMFALAIWDARHRRLFLARDRLGQKPLHYYHTPDRLLFASQIKALLQVPDVPRRLDVRSLDDYLTFQYVPHPRTMFDGLRKLPPAHWLLWEQGRVHIERYWAPDFSRQSHLSTDAWAERIRHELAEATRLRMVSDVPLGAFLSGGIDSSITVGLMARASSSPVQTFSIGFKVAKFDELAYARQVAQHFHTDHHEFVVEPDCDEVLPDLVWQYDEPFADSSAIPTYYVSKITREHVTVALTGDAGDECFAGYPRYKAVKLAGIYDRLPWPLQRLFTTSAWQALPASVRQKSKRRRLKKLLRALADSPQRRYLRWIAIFDDLTKQRLLSPRLRRELADHDSAEFLMEPYRRFPKLDFVGRTTLVDLLTYLPCDLLTKVDVASMAHGLECRSPFLDHKVVELAGRIPTHLKLRGLCGKSILKHAFRDLLPRRILTRAKMGFGVPIDTWFRGRWHQTARDILLDPVARRRGYFQPAVVERLLDDHVARRWDHSYRLWSLLMFELWHRRFLDQSPRVGVP